MLLLTLHWEVSTIEKLRLDEHRHLQAIFNKRKLQFDGVELCDTCTRQDYLLLAEDKHAAIEVFCDGLGLLVQLLHRDEVWIWRSSACQRHFVISFKRFILSIQI